MKTLVLIFTVVFISLKGVASEKELGLGAVLGQPTGVSGNYFLGDARSVDMALAFDLGYLSDSFLFYGDYLFHKRKSIAVDQIKLGWYWGPGLFMWSWGNRYTRQALRNEVGFGPRVMGGINYEFDQEPVEVFGEAGLGLSISPIVSVHMTLLVGGRYYF